jgi:hypothetical protein
MKTNRTSAAARALDSTPPERITLHIYTIERHGLPRLVAITSKAHDIARLRRGGCLIERANGVRTYLAPDTVSRVDYTTREVTLDSIN